MNGERESFTQEKKGGTHIVSLFVQGKVCWCGLLPVLARFGVRVDAVNLDHGWALSQISSDNDLVQESVNAQLMQLSSDSREQSSALGSLESCVQQQESSIPRK